MNRATTGAANIDPVTRSARWLAVPVFIGLFGLIALGVSAEDSETYRENQISLADSGLDDGNGQPLDQSGSLDSDGELDSLDADPDPDLDGELDADLEGGGDGWNIMLTGDDGSISIKLGDGQSTATPSGETAARAEAEEAETDGLEADRLGAADTSGRDIVLQPDSDGSVDGLRLERDGRLVPLEGDQIEARDLVVRPTESGIEILRPDGASLNIERSGSDDGADTALSFADRGPDGTSSEVFPDEDGRIELGDGLSVLVEPGPGDDPSNPTENETSTPWKLIVGAVAVLLALSALAAFLARRRKPTEPFGVDFVGPEGIPPDRFDEFVAMLSADPIPGRAVRLAFLAAERGMPDLPARYPMETAFEWVRRVADRRPDLREPMYSLARHFAAARFTNDETSGAARDAALNDLRQIERLARTPAPDQKVPVPTA